MPSAELKNLYNHSRYQKKNSNLGWAIIYNPHQQLHFYVGGMVRSFDTHGL
jgi:hypothetical protein